MVGLFVISNMLSWSAYNNTIGVNLIARARKGKFIVKYDMDRLI